MIMQIVVMGGLVIALWIMIQTDIYGLNPTNELDIHVISPFGNEYYGFVFDGNEVLISEFNDPNLLKIMKGQTMCFIVVVFSEIWIALEARSIKKSMFKGEKNVFLSKIKR